MKRTTLLALAVSCILPTAYAQAPPKINAKTTKSTTKMSNPEKVIALLKSIETGDPAPAAYINPAQYKQHNLAVGDGLAGFGAVLQALPKGSAKVHTVRVFQDGDYVVAHTDYNFFGPQVGFDVFRFEHGLIVEHWDNLQPTPAQPNPSGHTMLDGPTDITDLGKTEANKKLGRAFVEDILVNGHLDNLPGYFHGDQYVQHNPQLGDGVATFKAARAAAAQQGIITKHDAIRLVLGSGNFVLVASEGTVNGRPTAFYNLFRMANGKIAEHWDTIQAIPAQAEWKNQNGKF